MKIVETFHYGNDKHVRELEVPEFKDATYESVERKVGDWIGESTVGPHIGLDLETIACLLYMHRNTITLGWTTYTVEN